MSFLHQREYLDEGDVVVVDCSHQCNVMLTTDNDFQNYRSGRAFHYRGGFFKRLPARIAVPHTGYWNITLDLGGGSANIKYSINVIK
jgi:hypothetical protein